MNNKGLRLPGEVYSYQEIKRFMSAFPETRTGIRNKALCIVYLRAALRCNEALDLRPCDLSMDDCSVTVMRGKGGKRRVVGIDEQSLDDIREWIKIRPESSFLFCTLKGGRMRDSFVRGMVKRIARRAGLTKRFHTHGFRHTGACQLADEGLDIRLIAAQLGHSSIAVTHHYLNHMNPSHLLQAMRSRSLSQ